MQLYSIARQNCRVFFCMDYDDDDDDDGDDDGDGDDENDAGDEDNNQDVMITLPPALS